MSLSPLAPPGLQHPPRYFTLETTRMWSHVFRWTLFPPARCWRVAAPGTAAPPMFSSLVAVLASRRGSFSLPRRKEDYTFDRSTLQSVRASACAGTALPPVFFLLTSTPNRADRLPVLLGTMRAQSHPPTGVVLSIPRMPHRARTPQPRRLKIDLPLSHVQAPLWTGVFARFNESYRLPGAAQWPELRVHRIAADAGPLSKVRARARVLVRVQVRVP